MTMASRPEARRRRAETQAISKRDAPPASRQLRVLALLALVSGAIYAPTLQYGLVWDDPISIERWLPALRPWTNVFFPPPGIPQFPPDYYRPLQLLSYHVDAFIGGGAPWAFHLTSVLLHLAATLLVYRAGLVLWCGSDIAHLASVVAALIFAVHPLHSESVAWIAARPDPMVALCLLSALLLLSSRRFRPAARIAASAALVVGALFSKETGASALLLLPLWVWVTTAPVWNQRTKNDVFPSPASVAVASSLAGGVYLVLRGAGLAHYDADAFQLPPEPVSAVVSSIGWYTLKLFWPFPQNAFVDDVPAAPMFFAAGAVAVLATLVVVFRAHRLQTRAYPYCVAWHWTTLAPALLLLAKPPAAPVAERYLYLPSIAFAWLVGYGFARLYARLQDKRAKQVAGLFVGCVLAALAGATITRNAVWRDDVQLWTDTAAKTTSDGMPLRNLGAALLHAGQLDHAETVLRQALTRRNDAGGLSNIHTNLGTIAMHRAQWRLALEHYRKAYHLRPTGDTAYNLGVVFLRLSGDTKAEDRGPKLLEAKQWFALAVANSPHDPDPHLGYGQVLFLLGEKELARQHFQRAFHLGLPPERIERVKAFLQENSP